MAVILAFLVNGGAAGGAGRGPGPDLADALAVTPVPAPASLPEVPADVLAALPFPLGERLLYDVYFGPFRVGQGVMWLKEFAAVHDHWAIHAVFGVRGRALFYSVDDRLQSWFDPRTFVSYRFRQTLDETRGESERRYEIDPDRQVYRENGGEAEATSENPLDDVSFLYFMRSLDYTIGQDLELSRYFKPRHNPLRVRVVGRETVKVAAGQFACLVLAPEVAGRGIFRKGGEARVWLSDDPRRLVVRVYTKSGVGSLQLRLREVSP